MKKTYIIIILILLASYNPVYSQITNSKKAVLEKEFDSSVSTFNYMGDLFFKKNGNYYWMPTFVDVMQPEYEYYRVFELIINEGYVKEVTNEMLGGYYQVGAPNPPYYYIDIDNDGIKDIFVFDHGKEYDPDYRNWADYNVFFKGTPTGFVKTEIPIITTVKGYNHGHAIGDFDNDGDNDISYFSDVLKIFKNDGKGNFSSMEIDPSTDSFIGPLGLKFINLDDDDELELIAPPYRSDPNNPEPYWRSQIKILDFVNNRWTINGFGQYYPWLNPSVSGCEQILSFPNSERKFPDLIFRIAMFNDGWYYQYYRNDETKYDSIIPVNYELWDIEGNYTDPKVSDLDFDGFDDIFFKEYTFNNNDSPKPNELKDRIWINDGKNNFHPIPFQFNSNISKKMYLFVKSDSIKKLDIFMSFEEIYDSQGRLQIYTSFDTLIFPIQKRFDLSLGQNDALTTLITHVPVGFEITKNPKNGTIQIGDSTLTFISNKNGLDTLKYKLKNDFFESEEYEIIYNINDNDTSHLILSNYTIDENLPIGTEVGTLSTTDSDSGDSFTYSLVSGTGDTNNSSFSISGDKLFTNEVFDFETKNSYSVRIQTEDSVGDIYSDSMTINIINEVEVGIRDYMDSGKIKIYPNPVNEKLTIETSNSHQLEFRLTDVNGKQVIIQREINNNSEINLHGLSNGVYFVKLMKDDIVVHQQKIVKY